MFFWFIVTPPSWPRLVCSRAFWRNDDERRHSKQGYLIRTRTTWPAQVRTALASGSAPQAVAGPYDDDDKLQSRKSKESTPGKATSENHHQRKESLRNRKSCRRLD